MWQEFTDRLPGHTPGQQGKLWPRVKASLLPVFYTAFIFLMVEKFQMRKLFFDVKIM